MRCTTFPRSTIFLGSCILIVIITLTYNRSFKPHFLIPTEHAINSPCRIWADWEGLDAGQLRFSECDGSYVKSIIGDAAFIGDPHRCLLPDTRFDQYLSPDRNWNQVRWGQVQKRCRDEANKETTASISNMHEIWRERWHAPKATTADFDVSGAKTKRTAIVLRTWDNYKYTDKRLAWLRALITEVSLHRDNGYDVFFLVNIKDSDIDLTNTAAYAQLLRETVPEEFQEMAFLFNVKTLAAWYPRVNEHGAQDQMYQALQIFSHKFPDYEYIWQLEMDLRFTSHVHKTLESASTFARSQTRRNLWERNGRFYIPELHGHSFQNFTDTVDAEMGDTGVWGPVQTNDFVPKGPSPPPRSKRDWGVGEEADLITLMPMIDPKGTDWIYEDYVTGFADGKSTPRRVAIVSITRASRRLLSLVADAQQDRGRWLVSEATLETFALLHGLKAVAVPHPISFGVDMTAEQLDAQIHRGPLYNKAGGKEPLLFFSRIHGFMAGPWWEASYWFTGDGPKTIWEQYLQGKPMPPMIIHPVKEE